MPFDLKATDDERSLPRGGPPVDAPRIVAEAKRIERLELGAGAELPRALQLVQQPQFGAEVLLQLVARGEGFGQHVRSSRGQSNDCWAFDQRERTGDANPDRAERMLAALRNATTCVRKLRRRRAAEHKPMDA